MRHVYALLSGLIFGLGLILGGMTDPMKVKGFLDLFGHWDPSLALVMGGAVAVVVVAHAVAGRRTAAWTGEPMERPGLEVIDVRLVLGGLLFGVGWGIAGFCPGPALVAMSRGIDVAWIFGSAMFAGMWLHDRFLATR